MASLALIAQQTGRPDMALELMAKATRINPREPCHHSNYGNMLAAAGRLDEAIASFRKALALTQDFPAVWNNLGNALREQKKLDDAITSFRKSLALRPDDAQTHYHLAMALLAAGDLKAGWAEHEWRWQTPLVAAARRAFTQPQWQGEPAPGKTLLIHAEQGLGDTLQFCRYAGLAAGQGLRVILEVPPSLTRLLRTLPGPAQIVTYGEALPEFDLHIPMLSLPLALGTSLQNIPGHTPYLHAEPAQAALWRDRLAATSTGTYRVGLAWAGNPRTHAQALAAVDARRSIAPARLAPLFAVPGVQFFSLQKDGPLLPAALAALDYMPEMSDFADTAALVANLDLVISVDTAVAHLAGALGKPVWLLDRFDACWRWLVGRRDSPWYPGLRIYRQPKPGDWETVLGEMVGDLTAGAANMAHDRRGSGRCEQSQ